ncbi:unnamed protein product [Brassicogethes aeneus]|uniref:C2H2-type domain-containing protein n=1 Tax=Brassicogethes aeneus TaxID=1431903 RepID=A0A9P0AUV6_BRAAE|nr:unnamed protein product [Brassicogethes aeneus]
MEQTVVKKEPEELVDISEGDISMNYDNQEIPSTSGITIKQEIKEELDNDEVLLDKGRYIISLPQRYLNIPAHNFGSKINNSEENDNSVDEDESRDLSCNIKEEGMDIDFAKGDKISLHNKEKDEDEAMFETKIKVEHHGVQYDESGTNQEVANKELVEETGKEIRKNLESGNDKGEDNLECKYCSTKFFKKELLESHEKKCLNPRNKVDKEKLFSCDVCLKKYQTKRSLNEHTKYIHLKDKLEKIKCSKCDFATVRKDTFKTHLKNHEEQSSEVDKRKLFKCELCFKKYQTRRNLSEHKKYVHTKHELEKFKCSECDFVTVRKDTFKTHLKIHDKQSYLKCYFCPYVASQLRTLDSHILSKHKVESKKENNIKITSKIHCCSKCSYSTVKKSSYDTHLKVCLKLENVKWYECHICQYKTILKSNLSSHTKIHSNTKQLKCLFCRYQCNIKQNLDNHILTKHSDMLDESNKNIITNKVHWCEHCEYKTTQISNFKYHLKNQH